MVRLLPYSTRRLGMRRGRRLEKKFEYNNQYSHPENPVEEEWDGQTFTPQIKHKLSKVVLYGQRINNPLGNFIVSIRATDIDGLPTGDDLVVKSVLASSISTEIGEIEIVFDTQITLDANVKYAIGFRLPNGDGDNYLLIYWQGTNPYPRGGFVRSFDSGETWNSEPDTDFWFEEWGYRR